MKPDYELIKHDLQFATHHYPNSITCRYISPYVCLYVGYHNAYKRIDEVLPRLAKAELLNKYKYIIPSTLSIMRSINVAADYYMLFPKHNYARAFIYDFGDVAFYIGESNAPTIKKLPIQNHRSLDEMTTVCANTISSRVWSFVDRLYWVEKYARRVTMDADVQIIYRRSQKDDIIMNNIAPALIEAEKEYERTYTHKKYVYR